MAFDFATNYLLSQGPLSDQEQLLKTFLLRDQLTKFGAAGVQATGEGVAGIATNSGAAPAGFTPLSLVRPGDLITADYINTIVSAVNDILTYIHRQQYLAANAANAATGANTGAAGSQFTTGIIGVAKDTKFAAADANNNVEISFPAEAMQATDLTDILVGNTRIDPASLVKTATGYSFTVPQSALGDKTVRLVAKAGATNRLKDVIG
jgi:hypothetical protein